MLDQDEIINNLTEWMIQNNFDFESYPYLKLKKSDNLYEGRCIISLKDVQPGTNLVEFGENFLINYRHALKKKDLVDFFEWYSGQNSHLKLNRLDSLYLFLIFSKFDKFSWANMFTESMPVDYDTPEYFQLELIESLPNCFKIEINKRLEKFNSRFNFIKSLLESYPNHDNSVIQKLRENFNYNSYRWAFCSVNSRCFHINEDELSTKEEIELANRLFGDLQTDFNNIDTLEEYTSVEEVRDYVRNNQCCLIPYLDFLNHSFESNAYAVYDSQKKIYSLKSQEEKDELNTGECQDEASLIKKDKQIYITYGYHDNKTLFIEYGFIIEDNIYDKIGFRIDDFKEFITDYEISSEFIWKQAINDKLLEDLTCNTSSGPSWNLVKLLDLIAYSNSNLKNLSKSPAKKTKLNKYQSYEIQYPNDIKEFYIKLLKNLESELLISKEELTCCKQKYELNENFKLYHYEMSIKLVETHLNMIKSNFDIVNDIEQWNLIVN